ncbi:MAG: hypothetical protein A2X94_14615 [Bdellovibrionales bacterium GWB1_55_8]|nr:MAG: hypothetical protein A2X94_14615 [Bdellovibrionales bacterium GWB1_55_8]
MNDLNKIFLVGRLGTDPVQRDTRNGIAVVNFPLATTRRSRKSDDEAESGSADVTQWHKIVVWGKEAENCARYLKKGEAVLVEGNVRSHRYEGKDGQSRTAFEVHAENVRFLSGHRKGILAVAATEDSASDSEALRASG